MKPLFSGWGYAFALALGLCWAARFASAVPAGPVTLTDTAAAYTLDNGIVAAKIDKRSGDVISLKYHDLEFLEGGNGRSFAYWSLPGTTLTFGSKHTPAVRVDPEKNGGQRGTVEIQFVYDGRPNTAAADIDLIYSLAQNDSALYIQGNWRHKPEYPTLTFGPGRFAAKLSGKVFDYMTIDENRRRVMSAPEDWRTGITLNMKEARRMTTGIHKGEVEHKYDYSAVQFDTPAYGWSSTEHHVGLWLVTPSNEYMSGGATKLELNAHLDGNDQAGFATILNVWKGPHYGGSTLVVPPGEEWSKCIGPFLLYCNSAESHDAMWKDALARAGTEAKAWPYDWVNTPEFYTPKEGRGTVSGQVVLKDPLAPPGATMSHLLVGLAAPDWTAPGGRGQLIDWQTDSKFYEFWVHGQEDGRFVIPNVRPGKYTLHAFATGVLGEYAQSDITVEAGKSLDLGQIAWTPIRYGKQLWDIGVADRTAGEFFHGDHYWVWGLYVQYPKDFPNDVNYTIGKSDYHKDWNIMQVPRARDETGRGMGAATTWAVNFDMDHAPHGKATLRIAFAGTEARQVSVSMNGQPAGTVMNRMNTMVIHRDSDRGYWAQQAVAFDASLMKAGKNVLNLTVPAGNVTAGVEYDYLRLELDENAAAPPPPSPAQELPGARAPANNPEE